MDQVDKGVDLVEIMQAYSDLLIEIEVLKEQIDLTEKELEYWSLDGEGGKKFGANTSLKQIDKKEKSLTKLRKRLKELEYTKVRIDMLLEKLVGLDYKIAYKRIVEHKTHKEIASELGYTEQYIREKWASAKTYKQPTHAL